MRTNPPIDGAVRSALPAKQAPQLSQLAAVPPTGPGWISEIKFDGYRLLVFLNEGKVRVLSRNGLDWTNRLPALTHAVAQVRARTALLDGELVALRPNGISSFADLQDALSEGRDSQLLYYAFDLLYLNGWDLRSCGLLDRKQLLSGISDWQGLLRYSDHIVGEAVEMYRHACAMGLEGIVCKRANAPYRPGRSSAWLKVKCRNREELVVLGWTPPKGHRSGLGSLHVGYYDPSGKLHYAGGVGTGFSERELTDLRQRLERMTTNGSLRMLYAGDPLDRTIRWVRPELVIEVEYASWSGSGRVRHSVFLGVREDKKAIEVVRDIADPRAARMEMKITPRAVTRGD